jgi:hypothetical protein
MADAIAAITAKRLSWSDLTDTSRVFRRWLPWTAHGQGSAVPIG